jgi:hypothetical protein
MISAATRRSARTVFGAVSNGPDKIGERGPLMLGDFGRVEIGLRRGLPDVLTGYAPNNYKFDALVNSGHINRTC